MFNSTSLLRSSIFSVPSNSVTNRLEKLGAKSEKIHFRSRQHIIGASLLWKGRSE